MKSTGMLFNGNMIRAILQGKKTQTRRIVKPQPLKDYVTFMPLSTELVGEGSREKGWTRCPYGSVGDRLWVRETWADLRGKGFDHPFGYRADTRPCSWSDLARIDYGIKWKPSIHMPREGSRITLEITGVRVERLQDISEEDAMAEGVETWMMQSLEKDDEFYHTDAHLQSWPVTAFGRMWDSLAKPGADWASNPFCWVIEFKRLTSSDSCATSAE